MRASSPAPNDGRLIFTPASTPQPIWVCWKLHTADTKMPQSVAWSNCVVRDVDVVDHAGDLGLAPALLDVQGADEVRPLLAAVSESALGQVGAAAGVSAALARRRYDPGSALRSSR